MEDQGAVVVKMTGRLKKGSYGLHAVPSGLPEGRSFDLSSHFKVIQRENSVKDKDLNERIQQEGAHYNGSGGIEQPLTGGEAEWYARNKGYSKRINYETETNY